MTRSSSVQNVNRAAGIRAARTERFDNECALCRHQTARIEETAERFDN